MIDMEELYDFLEEENLSKLAVTISPSVKRAKKHGDFQKWEKIFDSLPNVFPVFPDFSKDAVTLRSNKEIDDETKANLRDSLKALSPWRKGPFDLFGVYIDSEWRSDLKWNRFIKSISPLEGRNILDVGGGNGYYALKMLGEKARTVINIEPYLLSVVQFCAVKKFLSWTPAWTLPLGVEEMPENLRFFDAVFSMGVFYHRRSPFEHLAKLKSFLREGGELVLETLVIEGKENEVLVPRERYAKMRNVWFIPSVITLESWLVRAGFKNIRLVEVAKTTTEEQRKTEWMNYESLEDFLDKENSDKTIEGYPAPTRAIFVCESP